MRITFSGLSRCMKKTLAYGTYFIRIIPSGNVKEITYSNLTNVFETKINSIKTIINGHRSQLECKLAKDRKTKNEQSTDVTYTRIFVHYGHLDFLLPVMRAAENKDVLKLNAENMGQEEIEPKILQTVKRGYTAERKVDL